MAAMQLGEPVVNLTKDNFRESDSGSLQLVGVPKQPHQRYGSIIFTGVSWCGFCLRTKPAYETVARKYVKASFPMYFLDGDSAPDVLAKLDIRGFPTFVFVSPNGELTDDKLVGAMDADALTSAISQRIRTVELALKGE
jgi:thiol-disulfide isomerase/thioredoxin